MEMETLYKIVKQIKEEFKEQLSFEEFKEIYNSGSLIALERAKEQKKESEEKSRLDSERENEKMKLEKIKLENEQIKLRNEQMKLNLKDNLIGSVFFLGPIVCGTVFTIFSLAYRK